MATYSKDLDPDGRDPRIKERWPLEPKKSKRKWIIVALLLVAPWLALAGCKQKATLDAGFVPAAVTETVHELPPVVVTATRANHVVKHSPKRRHVQHVAPVPVAPAEPTCHDLDVVCHLIKATR